MPLSRKYYRMFAEVIADQRKSLHNDAPTLDALTDRLMSELKQDNSSFDKEKFMAAAHYGEGVTY